MTHDLREPAVCAREWAKIHKTISLFHDPSSSRQAESGGGHSNGNVIDSQKRTCHSPTRRRPLSIFTHATCELGDDVVALEAANRSRAARILVRPMLESLFSLVAAAKDPSFPARKIVAEQEDEIERIKVLE
jgi:hypothetical protein